MPSNTSSLSETQPPEDFYRSSAASLSEHHDNNNNAVSPADSQAPIMASGWTAPNADRPSSANSNKDEPQYPPVPVPSSYRASAGAVNGEIVGAAVSTPTETQYARYPIAPLSAGLKTSRTMYSTHEEQRVAELEEKAQAEDRRDLAVKLKVRLAKVVLRSINCACSLVVLALVASTFAIFNATRHLAPRNGLPPWAVKTPTWPQITILVIASLSLMLSLFIMYSYWKGGHSKAEKVALHATIFAGAVFIFTIALWSVGIGIMQASRSGNDDKDLWGWACKDNTRRKLFQDSVNYSLVCRQQDWVVVCAIIEISVEFLAICVYLFAFYRLFYTKRRLRKSMNVRDEARNSLWLIKLKEQRDAEGPGDHETDKNTALNSNTAYNEAEEGRAVPILQPAPAARNHAATQSDASDAPLNKPPPAFARMKKRDSTIPPTPRSVSFMPPPGFSRSDSR
jgi:hypothetical protein